MVHHSLKVPDQLSFNGDETQQQCSDIITNQGPQHLTQASICVYPTQRSITERLRDVSETVRFIHSLDSPKEMMRAVTEKACAIFESRLAIASFAPPDDASNHLHAVFPRFPHSGCHEPRVRLERSLVYQQVRKSNQTIRLDQNAFQTHPDWPRKFSNLTGKQWPTNGILPAPLVGPDGRNAGPILLAETLQDEFPD